MHTVGCCVTVRGGAKACGAGARAWAVGGSTIRRVGPRVTCLRRCTCHRSRRNSRCCSWSRNSRRWDNYRSHSSTLAYSRTKYHILVAFPNLKKPPIVVAAALTVAVTADVSVFIIMVTASPTVTLYFVAASKKAAARLGKGEKEGRGGVTDQLWSQLEASRRPSRAPSTPPVIADSCDES